MSSKARFYDISLRLGDEALTYPGDPEYSRKELSSTKDGQPFNLSSLSMSAHHGTHLDMPAHIFEGRTTVDELNVDRFVMPARVIDIKDSEKVCKEEIEDLDLKKGEALLFKSRNSKSGLSRCGVFSEDYVYISREAAEFCVSKEIALLGIDYVSVDDFGDEDLTVHRILLNGRVLILEGIVLDEVEEGEYSLFCFPLKIMGGEASPCRAVLAGGLSLNKGLD